MYETEIKELTQSLEKMQDEKEYLEGRIHFTSKVIELLSNEIGEKINEL